MASIRLLIINLSGVYGLSLLTKKGPDCMKKYEILYIIPTQYTDTEIEKIMVDIATLIEEVGGKVTRNENLGRIKLAYPINKVRHGSYILTHFEADPSIQGELDRKLRLTDEILRHQIVTMVKGADDRKYEISSYIAPLSEAATQDSSRTKEKSSVAPASSVGKEEKKIAPPTPAKTEESKLSMEELDKKLDEILESEVK